MALLVIAHVDASFATNSGVAGIGVAFLEPDGTMVLAHGRRTKALDSTHAERLAVLEAITAANRNGLDLVRVFTDHLGNVERFAREWWLARRHPVVEYFPREINLLADALARAAFRLERNRTLTPLEATAAAVAIARNPVLRS